MSTKNGNGNTTSAIQPGAQVREEFGSTQLMVAPETSAAALAARAQAMVQAAFVMAERHPRDLDDVRIRLLKECERPGFAFAARYSKPVGKGKVEGPSIRFAEAALRAMGNMVIDTSIVRDDPRVRTIEVVIIDVESNVRFTRQVSLAKTVERKAVPSGSEVLGQRTNTYGETVYILSATDDELSNKQAAAVSKALRTEGLRLLPGDILEECMAACVATQRNKDAADPDQARKDVADGFSKVNVSPSALKEYLGHDLGTCTPAELADLRGVYFALRDGETSWKEVMDERLASTAPVAPASTAPPPAKTEAPTQAPPATAQPAKSAERAARDDFERKEQDDFEREFQAQQSRIEFLAKGDPVLAKDLAESKRQEVADAAPPPTPAATKPEVVGEEEQKLAAAYDKVTKRAELMAILKMINRIPESRRPSWRAKFQARMQELTQ